MKNTKTETTPAPVLPLRTKHLASKFGIKATALRRVLRSMNEYADGVHTNYRWAENDPMIPKIQSRLAQAAKEKEDRAKAAKLALDARAKEVAASKKAAAKSAA